MTAQTTQTLQHLEVTHRSGGNRSSFGGGGGGDEDISRAFDRCLSDDISDSEESGERR